MSKWSDWYKRNQAVQYARIKVNLKKRNSGTRTWLESLKEGKICLRCGFDDYKALGYHHRDPTTKSFNLADATRLGYGKKRILIEIEKCDLICANCHSIEHYLNRG